MFLNLWNLLNKLGNFLSSYLLLVIRLYWGYQFLITGFGKLTHLDNISNYFQSLGIPFPLFNATLTGCTEMIGGGLLLIGLFSRIAAIPLLGVMTVAYLTAESDSLVILFTHLDPSQFFIRTPFLFAYATLLVFCFGPGKISFDYWITGAYRSKKMP
jgi:putative oxidoreductase